jgi:PAS domain-containing protein
VQTETGFRALFEIAARPDQGMLPAFSTELATLEEIDVRLPRSIMRVGFAACIQALRNYEESEQSYKVRVQGHDQRILACVDAELAWLRNTTNEPKWPVFPNAPSHRKKRVRIGPRSFDEVDEEPARPQDVVSSSEAAKWLQAALPLLQKDTMVWFRAVVDSYAEWTAVVTGAGLDGDFENHSHMEWDMTYFDLATRTFVGLSPDEVDHGVLQRALTFPEEPFFETAAVIVRTLDDLYFNGEKIGGNEAIRIRSQLSDKLRQTRGWRRAVEEKSITMEVHMARSVSALFLHNDSWSGGQCYLNRKGADGLKVFLPLLLDPVQIKPPYVGAWSSRRRPRTCNSRCRRYTIANLTESGGTLAQSALSDIRRCLGCSGGFSNC